MLLTVEGSSVTLKSATPVQPEVEHSRLDMLMASADASRRMPDCRIDPASPREKRPKRVMAHHSGALK